MTNTETAHGNSEVVTMVVEMTVNPEHEQEFLDLRARLYRESPREQTRHAPVRADQAPNEAPHLSLGGALPGSGSAAGLHGGPLHGRTNEQSAGPGVEVVGQAARAAAPVNPGPAKVARPQSAAGSREGSLTALSSSVKGKMTGAGVGKPKASNRRKARASKIYTGSYSRVACRGRAIWLARYGTAFLNLRLRPPSRGDILTSLDGSSVTKV